MPSSEVAQVAAALSAAPVVTLGRILRRIEDDPDFADDLLATLQVHPARGLRVGVTGPAGVGKSTLCAALARTLREQNQRVGVLAIDPSSPRTGGAVLGDRLRFGAHAHQDGLYLRSLATRGETGGLAAAVEASCRALEVAGYDVVLIETVGVGQDEVEVADVVDVVVVCQAPGLGDDIQAMKAGLLEIADVLVVNKADREGAARAAAELDALRRWTTGGPTDVLQTIAQRGVGVAEVWAAVAKVGRRREASETRQRRLLRRVSRLLEQRLRRRWKAAPPAPGLDRAALLAEARAALTDDDGQ